MIEHIFICICCFNEESHSYVIFTALKTQKIAAIKKNGKIKINFII